MDGGGVGSSVVSLYLIKLGSPSGLSPCSEYLVGVSVAQKLL